MRRFLTTFCLIVFLQALQSQDVSDSLNKYSYLVQLQKNSSKTQGTGFFVRYHERLFFISGWNPYKQTSTLPDTVFIRLSSDTSSVNYLSLPVAGMKKKEKALKENQSADLYVIEIKNPKKYPVFSLEQFFDEVPCDFAKAVYISGYIYDEAENDYRIARQQAFTMSTTLDQGYCIYTFRPDVKQYDELHYFTSFKGTITGSGLSGAPAYLLTKNEKIVFGGIYVGGLSESGTTGMIVRPEYVIDQIMAKILKN